MGMQLGMIGLEVRDLQRSIEFYRLLGLAVPDPFPDRPVAVDAEWEKLTSAGYHGRRAPSKTVGPYAAMVDDPDGNVVLISSDPAADPAAPAA
jgi:predicted lactoylglutathione lyase